MSNVVAPLVGVLIGGVLTILGQFLAHRLETNKEHREHQRQMNVASLLQQDAFWTFQNVVAVAVRNGTWPQNDLDERYAPSRDDMRVMADALDFDSWRAYSTAVRSFSEWMRFAPGSELSKSQLLKLLAAYGSVKVSRRLLTRIGGRAPLEHRLGPIELTVTEVLQEFGQHGIVRPHASEWADNLVNCGTNRSFLDHSIPARRG
jgi:hypothetical protein